MATFEGLHPRTHLFVPLTISPRISMEEHFQRQIMATESGKPSVNCSTVEADPPPPYDQFLSSKVRRKFNIQPREDEGQEVLPQYSCAISLENVFLRKMELEGAVHRAHDRNWNREVVTLQGTALTFHKFKSGSVFSSKSDGRKPHPDYPAGMKKGLMLKNYNLQHAEVGVAADYVKKKFVIRVRAEADQFLLSCHKIETFVLWLQSLSAAIDLATPLDDRDLPRDLSIPRPRRRRAERAAQRNANMVLREQEEILARDFPRLAAGSSSSLNSDLDDTESVEVQLVTATLISPRPPTPEHRSSTSRLFSTFGPNSRSYSSSSTPNPSLTETGKWRPHHQWTPFYDMLYAKRCMAILTSRSPRKSNLVIMKGKRWVVDWATGKLTKWVPKGEEGLPSYDGGVEEDGGSREVWRVGQYGDLVRV